MNDHYYTANPESASRLREFSAWLRGKEYQFRTDAGVFSRDSVDTGTALLVSVLPCGPGDRVLDLGCGYGPIGVVAADLVAPDGFVIMVDVNERAVQLANANAQRNGITNAIAKVSDGCRGVDGLFDWIVTNPPIRLGKVALHTLLVEAENHLRTGGGLLLVIRTKQGAKSMAERMASIFADVETVKKGSGFRVLLGRKQ